MRDERCFDEARKGAFMLIRFGSGWPAWVDWFLLMVIFC